ncbi:MAG: glycosyltransferase [candidate division Zixibacteria bacterium]|nr:glycosyltransferase [candidate division Zixibacteria bacterium]
MIRKADPGIFGAARSLMQSGDFRSAETLLKNLVADYPDDPNVACAMADCYAGMPDYESAEYWYRRAVSIQPYNPQLGLSYNRFRIANLRKLPQDRPKFLIGPLMGAAYFFANYADCVFYGSNNPVQNDPTQIQSGIYSDISNIIKNCPNGFTPEKIICMIPEYNSPPAGIEDCGIETVGVYTDLPAHSEMIALTAPLFDICLTQGFHDGPDMLLRLGARKSGTGFFIGDDPLFWRDTNNQRDIDILFLSTFQVPHLYRGRNRIINELVKLTDKYKIVIGTENQKNSAELSTRAKIVINSSHSGELTSEMIARRIFESMSCGALCFAEENIEVVKHFYKDKSEIVYYNPENLLPLLESYLKSDSERQRIAESGKKKTISEYTYARNIEKIFYLVKAEHGYRISDTNRKIHKAEYNLRRARSLFYSHTQRNYNQINNLLKSAGDQDPAFESECENDLAVVSAYALGIRDSEGKFRKIDSAENPILFANAVISELAGNHIDSALKLMAMGIPSYKNGINFGLPLYLVMSRDGLIPPERHTSSIYYIKIQEAYLQYPLLDDGFKGRIQKIVEAELNKQAGSSLCAIEKYEEAISMMETAVEEYANDYQLHHQLSIAYHETGKIEKALELSRKACELLPLNIEYRYTYCKILYMLENYEEIFETADSLLKADIRIEGSLVPIVLMRNAAAEKIKHPDADKYINDFLSNTELSESDFELLGDTGREILDKWRQLSSKQ